MTRVVRSIVAPLFPVFVLCSLLVPAGQAEAAPACTDPGGLEVGDVSFRGEIADDCYGVVTSPKNPKVNGAASDWTVNTIDGGLFGGDWDAYVKDDGTAGTTQYLGLNWTLDAPQDVTSGTWTLRVQDPPPTSFPVGVDILAVLKGSDRWAAYLFTGETFRTESTESGSFEINFLNSGGAIPGLSNMTLYFRDAPVTQVAEPGTVALVALGLAGLLGQRRRDRWTAAPVAKQGMALSR